MVRQSRRQHLRQLGAVFGSAALAGWPAPVLASDAEILAGGHRQGHQAHLLQRYRRTAGQRAGHAQPPASVCRPHVQQRRDDSRCGGSAQPEAGASSRAEQYTRTHHLQVSDDLLLLANGANIVAMQSYDNIRGYFENALADSITKRKKFRSGLSIHDISRPAEMREIAFLEMPGPRHQSAVVARRTLRLCVRAFRRFHRSHSLHGRPAEHHQAGNRVALVDARDESRGRRARHWRRAAASPCIT